MGKEDVYGSLVHHYVSGKRVNALQRSSKTSFSPFTISNTQRDRQTLKPGTQKQFGNLTGEIKIYFLTVVHYIFNELYKSNSLNLTQKCPICLKHFVL